MAENSDNPIVSAVPLSDREKGEASAIAFAKVMEAGRDAPPPVDANVKGPLTRFAVRAASRFVGIAQRFGHPRAELNAMAEPPPPPRTEQQIQLDAKLDADILQHARNMDRIEARPDTGEMTPRAPGFYEKGKVDVPKGKMAAPLGEMTPAFNADGTVKTTTRVPDAVRPFTEDKGVQAEPTTPPFTEKIDGTAIPPVVDKKTDAGGGGGGLNTGGVELPLDQIAALTGKRLDTSLPGGLNEQGLDLNALMSQVPKTQKPDIVPGVSGGNAQLTHDSDIRGVGPNINQIQTPEGYMPLGGYAEIQGVQQVVEPTLSVPKPEDVIDAMYKTGELKSKIDIANASTTETQETPKVENPFDSYTKSIDSIIDAIGDDPKLLAEQMNHSNLSDAEKKQLYPQILMRIDGKAKAVDEDPSTPEDGTLIAAMTDKATKAIESSGLPEDKQNYLKNDILAPQKKKWELSGKKLKNAMTLNNAYITFQIATMLMSIAAPESVTGH